MASELDWLDLVGRKIEIQWNGSAVRTGMVEAVTVSSDALWLQADGVDMRTLYEKAQGYSAVPLE